MSSKALHEGNKAIAEFMGGVLVHQGELAKIEFQRSSNHWEYFDIDSLHYHTSWDWLMPVVEKIEGLGFKFQICRRRVDILMDEVYPIPVIEKVKKETKIQSVWQACVEFINWYKTQK